MFETGVKADSDLAVEHGGSQQNGAILGNGCAKFLAKFMTSLQQAYANVSISPSNFELENYKKDLL